MNGNNLQLKHALSFFFIATSLTYFSLMKTKCKAKNGLLWTVLNIKAWRNIWKADRNKKITYKDKEKIL